MFSCKFMELESSDYFEFIVTISGRIAEIDTNDLIKEIFDVLYNSGYNDVTINAVYIENDDIEIFHVKGAFKDSIVNEIHETVEYFDILNNKILSLEEPDTEDAKQEDAGESQEELDIEELSLSDYKSMMDAWARDMRDKFAKEANLSKEEIAEQIDDSTKSFVSNMGILAQKILYISGSKIYADKIYDFCEECRQKDIFECARELRAFFSNCCEVHKERGTQKDIRVAMQLKEIFGDKQEQGIFGSIVSGFYWLYYKVKNYFKNVIQVHVDDSSIIGKIIEGVGLITNLVITGVKIIFTVVGHIASFIITVATKVAVALYDAVKNILQKIKNAVKAFRDKN